MYNERSPPWPRQQEVQGNGGFAGAGFAFQQKHVAARESAGEDVIQTFDTGGGFFTDQLVGCRQKCPLTNEERMRGVECAMFS
jgi:hypothetical protein